MAASYQLPPVMFYILDKFIKCFSKLVKVVRSVFKLVGFKLHALQVQPKHIIKD